MLKRLCTAAAILIFVAACEMMSPPPTPTNSDLQNTGVASPLVTPTPNAAPQWVETEMNGVTLGSWQPSGWTIDTSDGLLLAEHAMSIGTGEPLGGAMIYIFVPEVDHLEIAPDTEQNFAMSVLEQVVANPAHTGADVAVSDPTPFVWNNHQAAYYLINSGQAFKSIVIGVALPDDHERLVVINMTLPAAQAAQMRRMLPRVLHQVAINGVELHGTALESLPNPLTFPNYPQS